ncbi:MAG: glutaminyl-peptide cyclotransferase [Pseudomonadota bacterium]
MSCAEADSTALRERQSPAAEQGSVVEAAGDQRGKASNPPKPAPVKRLTARIVEAFPHDRSAFTQGLFFVGDALYETTGQRGRSTLRRVNLSTGDVEQQHEFTDAIFAEGSTAVGDLIFSISWTSGVAFVFDRKTFRELRRHTYQGQGWGLAYDGLRLVMSDGSARLRFFDPVTFEETGSVDVTINGRPLDRLNELEFVDGLIFANVWMSDAIVQINPNTGDIVGLIDARQLTPPGLAREAVLNGIAYKPDQKKLYLTGKNWPSLFEVALEPAAP